MIEGLFSRWQIGDKETKRIERRGIIRCRVEQGNSLLLLFSQVGPPEANIDLNIEGDKQNYK